MGTDDATALMVEVSRYLAPESGMDELAETVAQRITRLSLMADVIRDAPRGTGRDAPYFSRSTRSPCACRPRPCVRRCASRWSNG